MRFWGKVNPLVFRNNKLKGGTLEQVISMNLNALFVFIEDIIFHNDNHALIFTMNNDTNIVYIVE